MFQLAGLRQSCQFLFACTQQICKLQILKFENQIRYNLFVMETQAPFINVTEDEVTTAVMVYTSQGILWGNLTHHNMVMPSRILTGVPPPEFLALADAQAMFLEHNFLAKPIKHHQLMIPARTILGFHLMPPAKDQLDYDPTEPNRIMSPVTLYMGALVIKGNLRIAAIATVKTSVEVLKADFLTVYDIEISHPSTPKMSPIRSNMGYFRVNSLLLAE